MSRDFAEMSFSRVYPLYVAKAIRKGRTKDEVDAIIRWLTGYSQDDLERRIGNEDSFQTFFDAAPHPNPRRGSITGMICGVRVEAIQDPLTREVRYMDKLVDELANGKPMDKILRSGS